jgi:DNA-binding PadR family transcriptional regulator
MLELAILGFLKAGPAHGYELKKRLALLAGYYRPVSDGALYPAIARLEKQGWIARHAAPGEGAAPRQVLTLTQAGDAELLGRLRQPEEVEISDRNRFFTLLAFLSYLRPEEQRAILERRLAFIKAGRSFFERDGHPVQSAQESDPFRRGMLLFARQIRQAELAWLEEILATLS